MIYLPGLIWVILGIYCFYAVLFCAGLYRLKKPVKNSPLIHHPNVSVVIAARNESKNLSSLLNDMVSQDYPKDKLEIIVVDDRSTDNTWKIITDFKNEYLNFKGIQITKKSNKMTPKKHALSKAISSTRGEVILSTDGDCRVPPTWVTSMVTQLGNNLGIISGYSSLKTKNKLFHLLQKVDFLSLMSANAGAMGMGFSWAGSGQNLAYRKSYFNQMDGFRAVAQQISGDDIYLIQSISKIGGGAFNPDQEGAVTTLPIDTFSQFINQRIRWASNAPGQLQSQFWFLLFLVSAFVLNVSLLFHIVLGFFTLAFLYMWLLKIFMDGIVIFSGRWMFKTPVPFHVFLLWSLIQPAYIPVIGLLGISGRFNWKP